jgi:D-alanyl-D-alanine carboxypeptidase
MSPLGTTLHANNLKHGYNTAVGRSLVCDTDEEDMVINSVITDADTGEVEELQMQQLQAEKPRITWRINMRYIFHSSS